MQRRTTAGRRAASRVNPRVARGTRPHVKRNALSVTIPANRFLFPGLLVLLALNAIVFWPVCSFDFVRWDDDISVTQNPLLTDPWSGSLLARFFSGEHALRFKPLHWLLARGVHEAAGLNPVAWHAFNLGLHLASAALFYLILRQVTKKLIPSRADGLSLQAEVCILLGAATWSIHPLRAEPVAWVTASTYPLAALWLLGALGCYLHAHRPAAHRGWMLAAWIFAVMAYASYPVTITFSLWLIAVDVWWLGRRTTGDPVMGDRWKGFVLKHTCFLLPAALAVAITMWSRFATPGIFTTAPTVESVGLIERVTMALATLTALAGRALWPVNLTPNLPPLTGSALAPEVLALAAIAAGALLLAWRVRHRRPLVTLSVLGFAALSIPCLGLTERPNWPVDRYSYVAHLGLIGAVTIWLATARLSTTVQVTLTAATTILVISLAGAARQQSLIWRDTGTLFTHMAAHPNFEDNPRQQGHIYLLWANEETAKGNASSAAQLLEKAQQTYLKSSQRAVARGDYAEALSLSTHLERHFGLTPTLRRERGAWFLREHRVPEALRELQAAAATLRDDERLRSLLAEAEAMASKSVSTASDAAKP